MSAILLIIFIIVCFEIFNINISNIVKEIICDFKKLTFKKIIIGTLVSIIFLFFIVMAILILP